MARLLTSFFLLLVVSTDVFCQDFVAEGQMPNIVAHKNQVHLVYGREDTILYSFSEDFGKTFSKENVISVLPNLAASHTRGPQIAITQQSILITACNSQGDVFAFSVDGNKRVVAKSRVNDADTSAKENLMALSADGNNVFAVWLDARTGHNQIYGAASLDGGKKWQKNVKVYSSPDTTVCECCRPSVTVNGKNVFVMFRNWLDGSRDLYVIRSDDKGNTFGDPQKVGLGTWKLAGCPMDGGGFSVVADTAVHAVFNREGQIFACTLGDMEKRIGSGRSCTIDASNRGKAYSWVENGNVVCVNSHGSKTILGKGQLPSIKLIDSSNALCVWEREGKIMKAIVSL